MVDYDDVLARAKEVRPKLIVCGGSAYPRTVEADKFREIADEVGALLMCPVVYFYWDNTALLAHWGVFLLIGFLGTFGHLLLIRAYQRASAPVLTPYLYAQIAFATLLGWLVFDHVPDALAWLGIAVIAASGVGNAVLSSQEASRPRGAGATPAGAE